jgi:cation-transporting P-type ATPase D
MNIERSKNKIYDNCEIYDTFDNLISYCSKKRFDWYIKKGIVYQINDKAIKLMFQPNYKINLPKEFIKKENKCYCCGNLHTKLSRFSTVPREYKKYFPIEWKSYQSSDVLPLCDECHNEASICTGKYKKELEELYNISKDDFIDKKKFQIKLLAKKILVNIQIGIEKSHLEDKLKHLLYDYELNIEKIQELAEISEQIKCDDCSNTYEYIVKQIQKKGNDNFKEFIDNWKMYFHENMHPLDLPNDYFV